MLNTLSHIDHRGASEQALDLRRRHQVSEARSAHVGRLGRLRRRARELALPAPPIRIAYA